MTWRRTMESEMGSWGESWGTIQKMAKDRNTWRSFNLPYMPKGMVVLLLWSSLYHVTRGQLDGYKNNVNHPAWGMAASRLTRTSHASYADGAYEMVGGSRPSPMDISMKIHMGDSGKPSQFSRNALQAFYAQLILDEMVHVEEPGCPPEYVNMDLPEGHPLSQHTSRPQVFLRSVYDQSTGFTSAGPRQHINTVTSFLDGSVIYGTSHVWTNLLRSFQDGRLLTDVEDDVPASFPVTNDVKLPLHNPAVPKGHNLKSVSRLFRIGNPRGHENPFVLSLQVVWHRWHNHLAKLIAQEASNVSMTDNQIFEAARRRVVGHFQKIAWTEWLPHFLYGDQHNTSVDTNLPTYTGYDSSVHPGVSHEFLTAMAYRYTITPSAVWLLGGDGTGLCVNGSSPGRGPDGETRNVASLRLCNSFWDSQDQVKSSFSDIIRGMVYTKSELEDETFVSDFTTHFHGPYEYSRTDHAANLLQRYRDHGLPAMGDVIKAYGLSPLTDWDRMQGINGTAHRLFGGITPDDVDILTGGLLDANKKAGMSDVFRAILVDQFTRTRDGDRFWYQNKHNGLFTEEERDQIESTTFRDILLATSSLSDTELPQDLFLCQSTAGGCSCLDPPNTDDVTDETVDVCSPLATHDYVEGSRLSFVFSFIGVGLTLPASILVLVCLIRRNTNQRVVATKKRSVRYSQVNQNGFQGKEWLGPQSGYRTVKGELESQHKRIVIRNQQMKYMRYLEMVTLKGSEVKVIMSSDHEMSVLCIRVPGDTDLILQFTDYAERERFMQKLQPFLDGLGLSLSTTLTSEAEIFRTSSNKDERQKKLDAFFRVVCSQALDGTKPGDDDRRLASSSVKSIMNIRLSINEFAEALGMMPSSLFVNNMFLMADKKDDRYISFHEFRELFAIFLKGTAEEKARLLFNIYDIEQKGYMTEEDFKQMIKSMLELNDGAGISEKDVNDLSTSMFSHVGLTTGSKMRFSDFKKVFCSDEYANTLQNATISGQASKQAANLPKPQTNGISRKRATFIKSYRSQPHHIHYAKNHHKNATTTDQSRHHHPNNHLTDTSDTSSPRLPARGSSLRVSASKTPSPRSYLGQKWFTLCRFVDRYRWHIFWVTLYTLVTVGIFVEKAYSYAKEREHSGLRRMSGALTSACIRGSASAIMFTYASLLLTMCRNVITGLRETFLHRFVPFDSAVTFHKYIAVLAMIATVVHIIGHAINLYNMSTQTTASLDCFFREFHQNSDTLPHFHYWLFQTVTGVAGVLVTVLIFVMYVFATQYARRNVFKSFWATHSLYWLVYLLTLLHGLGRLVQAPLFPWYLVLPLVVFIFDRLHSISRKKVEIAVTEANPLPSGVLRLVFKRPANFSYRSGQWVRIACLALSPSEYHPFTLTSAPHEPTLSLHIRAVGPWTNALRKTYSNGLEEGESHPMLYLDGPFGEGHQDWYTFDVSILVGGGIGVTPFASILKDIAFKSRIGQQFTCKKVYFIWVTRTQKSFEWLVDILRDVEAADVQEIVSTHIFVTQFPEKYDLRTTMLYICERHFQKLEGKSLFTGLKAMTHFGRPKFEEFFSAITHEYREVSQVGVFSCGPGAMTSSVQKACTHMNSVVGPTFNHHFENF